MHAAHQRKLLAGASSQADSGRKTRSRDIAMVYMMTQEDG
jgi:hypothetical protein